VVSRLSEGPPFDGELLEALAEMRHAEYLREQEQSGSGRVGEGSLVPWDELPESLKQSNRLFAAGIPPKLREVGCHLTPVGADDREEPFAFADGELETLAQMEHRRWRSDLEAEGWAWGPQRDPDGKRHPMLVDWVQLSAAERDKDRQAVLQIPGMLLRLGYRVRRGSD
jgi:hypothetical protein